MPSVEEEEEELAATELAATDIEIVLNVHRDDTKNTTTIPQNTTFFPKPRQHHHNMAETRAALAAAAMTALTCRSDELALQRCMNTLHQMLTDRGFQTEEVGLTEQLPGDGSYQITPFTWNDEMNGQLVEHLLQNHLMPIFVYNPKTSSVAALVVIWKPLVGHHDLLRSIEPLLQTADQEAPAKISNLSSLPISWPPAHIVLLTMTPIRTIDWKDLLPIQKKIRIEAFHQGEMEFNRTRHELVPRHTLLSNDDAVAILQTLNTSGQQCPRILNSDIICRYYGGRVGDLFQIRRVDLMTGDSEITFRIVTSC